MYLPKFEYHGPTSLKEATHLLKALDAPVEILAGGTDLFPRMKYGLVRPEHLISLKEIPIEPPIQLENGAICLDAHITLSEMVLSPLIRKWVPLLAKASERVASQEIRNMATLGGNICQESRCLYYNQSHRFQFVDPCFKRGGEMCYFATKGKKCFAVYMGDLAPALMCLDAEVRILGSDGERQVPIDNIFSGDALCPLNLNPDEVLTKVIIPSQPNSSGWSHIKYSLRGGVEFAALNMATILKVKDGGKTCEQAGIVVDAIAPCPMRAQKAASLLKGQALSGDLIEEAAKAVAEEMKITPHHGFTVAYLREILKVQAKRALTAALETVGQ
jgi:4-hydroxybenzoyl-CoA reductase beta subunit